MRRTFETMRPGTPVPRGVSSCRSQRFGFETPVRLVPRNPAMHRVGRYETEHHRAVINSGDEFHNLHEKVPRIRRGERRRPVLGERSALATAVITAGPDLVDVLIRHDLAVEPLALTRELPYLMLGAAAFHRRRPPRVRHDCASCGVTAIRGSYFSSILCSASLQVQEVLLPIPHGRERPSRSWPLRNVAERDVGVR